MSNFYTSDTHWGHANVLVYDKRPWENVYDMAEDMIDRWNAVVTPEDTVYHLGDVAMAHGGRARYCAYLRSILEQLNGRKILIRGNHDDKPEVMLDCGFDEVHTTAHLTDNEHRLFLIHNPWGYVQNDKVSGRHVPDGEEHSWPVIQDSTADTILHGHLHIKGWAHKTNDKGQLLINVGCMRWDYTPQPLSNLLAGVAH